jgi:hypothetical protein
MIFLREDEVDILHFFILRDRTCEAGHLSHLHFLRHSLAEWQDLHHFVVQVPCGGISSAPSGTGGALCKGRRTPDPHSSGGMENRVQAGKPAGLLFIVRHFYIIACRHDHALSAVPLSLPTIPEI